MPATPSATHCACDVRVHPEESLTLVPFHALVSQCAGVAIPGQTSPSFRPLPPARRRALCSWERRVQPRPWVAPLIWHVRHASGRFYTLTVVCAFNRLPPTRDCPARCSRGIRARLCAGFAHGMPLCMLDVVRPAKAPWSVEATLPEHPTRAGQPGQALGGEVGLSLFSVHRGFVRAASPLRFERLW